MKTSWFEAVRQKGEDRRESDGSRTERSPLIEGHGDQGHELAFAKRRNFLLALEDIV